MTALFIIFISLLILAVPIGYSIGLSSFLAVAFLDVGPLEIVIQRTYGTVDSYTLLAIPFFILAGELMSKGGMSMRMINFANSIVGRMRGSLAQVSIVASMIFAGVSGSGAADASAIGSILTPTMKRLGYPAGWVAALQACAGTMGPIIPPSIIMIVYGSMTGVSIGAMFLGGAIPGIMIGIGLMGAVWALSYLPKYDFLRQEHGGLDRHNISDAMKDGVLTLIAPGLIICGIVFGVFTATEGGAVAAVYAFIISHYIYRELAWSDLEEIFVTCTVTTGVVLLITGIAGAFGWILTYTQFPQDVVAFLMGITTDKTLMLLIIMAFILLLTCFVETLPALIMMTPVLFQISTQMGYHPIHFGVVICITCFIGTVTPPVGVLLYVTTAIAQCDLKETIRHLPVFLTVLIVVTTIVALLPATITFLPDLLLKR